VDEPIALGPGEGGAVKADRPELSLLETTFDQGSGVDPHFHRGHSDSFYVLEGELEFRIEGDSVRASAGTLVVAPRGAVHAFPVAIGGTARFLNLHAPGGFDRYLRTLNEMRARGESPDAELQEAHDQYPV